MQVEDTWGRAQQNLVAGTPPAAGCTQAAGRTHQRLGTWGSEAGRVARTQSLQALPLHSERFTVTEPPGHRLAANTGM